MKGCNQFEEVTVYNDLDQQIHSMYFVIVFYRSGEIE